MSCVEAASRAAGLAIRKLLPALVALAVGVQPAFSQEDAVRRAPVRLIDLFRTTRRTRVRYVNGSWVVLFRDLIVSRFCRPGVFVNAQPAPSWVLGTLPTDDVQAVEVYWAPRVPGEFYRFNRCGAINIWTARS